ncbi:MAG: hypothetical protein JNM39_10155 [Bdellovibrionaceae bacterium]|nr:hypothetical protein [Pseudobdellovibrionaceae bacterium]
MRSFKAVSPVVFAFAMTLVFAAFIFSLDSNAAQVQPTSPRSWECKALLQAQHEIEKESPNHQNEPDYFNVMDFLRQKQLSFIDSNLLELISQDPRNQQLVTRLKEFDFEAPGASENLLQLLKDLRELAKKRAPLKERIYAVGKNVWGPSRRQLLKDATDLIITKESIDAYLIENLKSPTQSRLRSRLSHFIHGTFSILKPITYASLATWLTGFPMWTHRSKMLESLDGSALTDPSSLKMKGSLWLDFTTNKLSRLTLVAMFLFNSTTWVLGVEGNLVDYGKKAWTELNTAVVVTEAYAAYDADKPVMDPIVLSRTMGTEEYAKWAAEYQKEHNQKPDPENNVFDLLLWQTYVFDLQLWRTSPNFIGLRQTSRK